MYQDWIGLPVAGELRCALADPKDHILKTEHLVNFW
jgi:hypothetical protein